MEFTPERGLPAADAKPIAAETFAVDDLLDFSNDDGTFDAPALSDDSSPVADPVDSCNSSSFSGVAAVADVPHRSFSSDLCVPCDEVAELEWLSNFVEDESFSTEDLQKLHLISGLSTSSSTGPDKARPESNRQLLDEYRMTTGNGPFFSPESLSVPAKARSKRSRAAPCSWASRLQVLSPPNQMTALPEPELSACSDSMVGPGPRMKPGKKKGGREGPSIIGPNGEVRRCLHCATDKTPQWRTGPMGPKTLCNACGVRYKSGRLVPEYRPASSPTFVQTKHSNSHRKVMELRRQKEVVVKQQVSGNFHEHRQQVQSPPQFIHDGMVFDMPNPNEYLIHQHISPDFRQLI